MADEPPRLARAGYFDGVAALGELVEGVDVDEDVDELSDFGAAELPAVDGDEPSPFEEPPFGVDE